MIIRITFAENDWTYYIEQFCKGLRDKMFIDNSPSPPYEKSLEWCNKYMKWHEAQEAMNSIRRNLMNPDNHFRKTSKEYKSIIEEVLRLWREFAPSVSLDDVGDPNVSIQYNLKEQWENGEVVYYFTPQDVYVTM